MFDPIIDIRNVSKIFSQTSNQKSTANIGWLAMMGNLLSRKVKNATRKQFKVLNNISFSIQRGESIGIIGLNGSGKSTLLQIIAGTIQPTKGSIQTNGQVAALLELGSGFNPDFTGVENIYLTASLLGLNKNQISKKIDNIANFADIGDFINQPIRTYSSGMVMRLAFAIVANVDAQTLAIDEALAVGDILFTQKCMDFLKSFIKERTLILVSHDINAIRMICKRCIWLEQGIVKFDGPSKRGTDLYLESTQNVSKNNCSKDISRPKSLSEFQNISKYSVKSNTARSEFGGKYIEILEARLRDNISNKEISMFSGNEIVNLDIISLFHKSISKPIFGFILRNRLGLEILAENIKVFESESENKKNGLKKFTFTFELPILSNGQYTISVAVAEDLDESHVIHHWLHDAITINFSNHINCHGLVGINMKSTSIKSI